MKFFSKQKRRIGICLLIGCAAVGLQGCAMQWGAELQWNSKSQILMSEASQVKQRAIQTRVFETTDKMKIMKVTVAAMQDLFFHIDVLDPELGVVSGKKMFHKDPLDSWPDHWTYYAYETDNLIIFNNNRFRTWGPFRYRNDLTRMTVTVRPKEKTRLLVRASVQYDLQAVQDPEMYQKFFKTLEQSLFLSSQSE